MAGRPIIALVSLALLAAAVLFEFFIILSGVTRVTPFGHTYFISAQTDNIPGSGVPNANRVAWQYFGLAGLNSNGGTVNGIPNAKAAFPFQPRTNFDVTNLSSLPPDFRSGNFYYYASRSAWSFYIIALFFGSLALITGLLALCSRIGSFLSGALASVAAFFMALAAALMTSWTVYARNTFNKAPLNANAKLGKYAYGFTWAAFACYFLCMILFCAGGAMSGKKETTYDESKGGMFGRRSKSQRNKEGIRDDYS